MNFYPPPRSKQLALFRARNLSPILEPPNGTEGATPVPQSPGVPEHLARSSLGTAALGTTGSPGPAANAALVFEAQQTKAAVLESKRSLEKQLLVWQAGGQHGRSKPKNKPGAEQRALCSGSSSSAELRGWISRSFGWDLLWKRGARGFWRHPA